MPIHDWTRVGPGTFHDFHCAWIAEIRKALNNGVLPADYYAMAEQVAGELTPDVLTLQGPATNGSSLPSEPAGATAVAVVPPPVRFTAAAEIDEYALKQRRLVIRHSSEDRLVALLEIISPGNKSSRHAVRSLTNKVLGALTQRLHLLLIDLHPPGPRDPQGIHGLIWSQIDDTPYQAPTDKPLTLVGYEASTVPRAYIEPIAVGDVLKDMPLFLAPGFYVSVPLEATYRATWEATPLRWRRVLEG